MTIILIGLISVASMVEAYSQKYVGKQYYLRHPIIYLDKNYLLKVYSDSISFTEDCICGFSQKIYSGEIFNRGAAVNIIRVENQQEYAKVQFSIQNKEREIFLKMDSKESIDKAFDHIFSEKELVKRNYIDPKTTKEVIEEFGYPISKCKDGGVERWFYIIEFVGYSPYGGFDGFCITLKNGRVVDVTGYI
jgi:hypothetical protein